MNEYTCPINPVHDDPIMKATDKDSPHRGEIVCGVCDRHIKWASKSDIARFNAESEFRLERVDRLAELMKAHEDHAAQLAGLEKVDALVKSLLRENLELKSQLRKAGLI